MDSTDDVHIRHIRSLPIWSGAITLEPLHGGITNRNYLVHDGSERFVARVGEELLILGIDRRNELQCHRAAESLGVAPPLVYGENGVLVSRYIPSRTLNATDAREPGFAPRLAKVLRQLHDGWDGLIGDLLFFSPFQTSRTYVATSRRIGAELPADIDEMLEATRNFRTRFRPISRRFVITTCCRPMCWMMANACGSSIGSTPEWAIRSLTSAAFRRTAVLLRSKTSNFSRVIAVNFDRGISTSFTSSKSRACSATLCGASCRPSPRTSRSTIPNTPAFISRSIERRWRGFPVWRRDERRVLPLGTHGRAY